MRSRPRHSATSTIRKFSSEHFGEEVAAHYLTGIREAFQRIQTYPRIGERSARIKPVVWSHAYERHRIYYRIGEKILIVRILHEAQDARRVLRR